jgi:rhamnulose-1-phosphate aldolase
MHPEAVIFLPEGVGLVPYARTGSEALAVATVASLARHDVVIWEKHGVLAVGDSPHAALDRIDIVAKSARIWFLCRNAGYDPAGLSDDQLAELRAAFPPR